MVSAISQNYAAGDDLLLKFTVTVNGEVVDLTGMTITFVAARRIGFSAVISTEDTTPTATLVESDTGYLIDPEQGTYGISIEGAVTQNLSGTYEFQSRVTDGSGAVATVARGYLTF